jgi:2-oxoglutarate ferredoxin oxidoreductase subunit alpha
MITSTRPALSDLNVIVAGQGGDGSLTVANVIADLLREMHFNIYTERDVMSRIKGGAASAALRASRCERYGLGDQVQLLVAFDASGIHNAAERLSAGALVVYDDSDGPLPSGVLPECVDVATAPFARMAVGELSRPIYKSSIAIGFTAHALGLAESATHDAVTRRFERLGPTLLEANLRAVDMGFELARDRNAQASYELQAGAAAAKPRLEISGNDALAFGFLVAGGRFFAGYPITPATEIMLWLDKHLPRFGGIVRQVEDELAAVNMAIGAALAGVRSMTATSSPGFALMQEGISQAGSGEIPLVVVNVQRGGPSTGLPTKPEQSDLEMIVYGGNGEYPRIVLTPGDPSDCFTLAVDACNLAERFQCPVILALDQPTGQNMATIPPFDLDNVEIDRGKRLDASSIAQLDVYKRYAMTADGVSPYAVPATPGGLFLVTGNEHDEFGRVSTNAGNRVRMVEKRQRKLDQAMAQGQLPAGRCVGEPGAEVGLIGVGAMFGPLTEAVERLSAQGVSAALLQPRTVWPVLPETIEFVRQHQRVYVVEQNSTAQLRKMLVSEGADGSRIESVLRFDGRPMRAGTIVDAVLGEGGAQ